mmetsp:Transcript_12392/g.33819  ORF Transcript_12392/g.33819 Transcript_12392/m.33819 type:complete len:353 (-) Transcript_12392:775-1833(-)
MELVAGCLPGWMLVEEGSPVATGPTSRSALNTSSTHAPGGCCCPSSAALRTRSAPPKPAIRRLTIMRPRPTCSPGSPFKGALYFSSCSGVKPGPVSVTRMVTWPVPSCASESMDTLPLRVYLNALTSTTCTTWYSRAPSATTIWASLRLHCTVMRLPTIGFMRLRTSSMGVETWTLLVLRSQSPPSRPRSMSRAMLIMLSRWWPQAFTTPSCLLAAGGSSPKEPCITFWLSASTPFKGFLRSCATSLACDCSVATRPTSPNNRASFSRPLSSGAAWVLPSGPWLPSATPAAAATPFANASRMLVLTFGLPWLPTPPPCAATNGIRAASSHCTLASTRAASSRAMLCCCCCCW